MSPTQAARLPLAFGDSRRFVAIADVIGELTSTLSKARERATTLAAAFALAADVPYDNYFRRDLATDLGHLRLVRAILGRHLTAGFGADHAQAVRLVHDLRQARSLAEQVLTHLLHPRAAVLLATIATSPRAVDNLRALISDLTTARRTAIGLIPHQPWRLAPAGRFDGPGGILRPGAVAEGTGIAGTAGEHGFALLVLAIAVRALPASARSRYLEEFRAELRDHVSPPTRAGYLARLLFLMWRLRRSLPRESELRRMHQRQAEPIDGEEP